jgi:membrane protein DedA with SNARE-associated domain
MTVLEPLPGVLAGLTPVLQQWGYLAVGGLVFVEDFGVPVPGETVMIAAAVYAGAGRLDIVAVAVIALVAAVVGDNIGYGIGRLGGRRLVTRFGRYVFLTPARVRRAEGFFSRHGGKIISVARFVEGLRQVNGIIAGLAGLSWRRFLAFNVLGAALWVGCWVSFGYAAGQHMGTLYPAVQRYELYLLVGASTAGAALIVRRLLRRRSGTRRVTEHGPDDEGRVHSRRVRTARDRTDGCRRARPEPYPAGGAKTPVPPGSDGM